jgi:hypothetical protein
VPSGGREREIIQFDAGDARVELVEKTVDPADKSSHFARV